MKFKREVAHSEQMKAYSKYFVFLQINTDVQKNVAQAYGVSALPTFAVVDQDGKELGRTMGYGGPGPFFAWLDSQK